MGMVLDLTEYMKTESGVTFFMIIGLMMFALPIIIGFFRNHFYRHHIVVGIVAIWIISSAGSGNFALFLGLLIFIFSVWPGMSRPGVAKSFGLNQKYDALKPILNNGLASLKPAENSDRNLEKIQKLFELKTAGILTEEEFEAKKRELLK